MLGLKKFEIETVVYSTKNYDLFDFMEHNRSVNRWNVERIKESIHKKYITVPIIVAENHKTNKFEIGDGQHRFVACKELGYPIRFIIVENLDMKDVQRLNSKQLTWTIEDYLSSYIEGKNENYINFKLIKEKYNINYSDMLFLIDELSKVKVGEKQMSLDFKDGLLEFNNIEKVTTFLDDLMLLNGFNLYNDTRFVRAFFKLYASEFYDRLFLEERIKQSTELLIKEGKQVDIIGYGRLLAKMYSWGRKGIFVTYVAEKNYFEKLAKKEKRREL